MIGPLRGSASGQCGAALIASLVLLLVMTLLATTTMKNSALEQRMATNMTFHEQAFQAAESAAHRSIQVADFDAPMGDAGNYGESFDIDAPSENAAATAQVKYLDQRTRCEESSLDVTDDQVIGTKHYFEVDVEGQVTRGDETVAADDLTVGVVRYNC